MSGSGERPSPVAQLVARLKECAKEGRESYPYSHSAMTAVNVDDCAAVALLVEAGAALAAACLGRVELQAGVEYGCDLCGHVWMDGEKPHHFEECAMLTYERAVAALPDPEG